MAVVVPHQRRARGRRGTQCGDAAACIHRRGHRGGWHGGSDGQAHNPALALAARLRVVGRGRQRGVARGAIHHMALDVRLDAIIIGIPTDLVAVGARRARQRNLARGAQRDVAHLRLARLRVYRDRHRQRVAVAAILIGRHMVGGAGTHIVHHIRAVGGHLSIAGIIPTAGGSRGRRGRKRHTRGCSGGQTVAVCFIHCRMDRHRLDGDGHRRHRAAAARRAVHVGGVVGRALGDRHAGGGKLISTLCIRIPFHRAVLSSCCRQRRLQSAAVRLVGQRRGGRVGVHRHIHRGTSALATRRAVIGRHIVGGIRIQRRSGISRV